MSLDLKSNFHQNNLKEVKPRNSPVYEFEDFRLDAAHLMLYRNGDEIHLTPKQIETLLALVERSGEILSKEELMERLWRNAFVEESNLIQNIYILRKTLGETADGKAFIETLRRRGYRFNGELKVNGWAQLESASEKQQEETIVETAFQSDGSKKALSDRPRAFKSPSKGVTAAAFLIFVFLVGGFSAGYYFLNRDAGVSDFQMGRVERLTSNGNSLYPAISPDGKYLAYVLREAQDRLTIQLMHIETRTFKQIFAPAEYRDLGLLNFSPDGNYIYFAQSETYGVGTVYGIYRMSVLGGIPARLLVGTGDYAVSPDGAKLAFVRNFRESDESVLMIANADGTGEYKLAARKLSDRFFMLNWSPGGETIVCAVGSTEVSGKRMYPVEVNAADGTQREITSFRWTFLNRVIRMPDENGYIAIATDDLAATSPLWHISQDGEVRRLTDDSQVFSVISLIRDAKTLAFQNLELQTSIWTTPIGNETLSPAALARQITTGNDGYQVSYLPDGEFVLSAVNNRLRYDIWTMNPDGTGRRRLTENTGTNVSPVASRDGGYIVFESDRAGKINIWRMDADGGNPTQLTFGNNEKNPSFSPDGKSVVYTSGDNVTSWIVSVEGGEPRQLLDSNWRGAIISPDGKRILACRKKPEPQSHCQIGILGFESGEPVKMFDIPPEIQWHLHYQWMPDSEAFIYVGSREGVFNIWKQPIKGGKPSQLTDFKSTDQIYSLNFSPDGKQIVFTRGGWTYDIFLIRDFR